MREHRSKIVYSIMDQLNKVITQDMRNVVLEKGIDAPDQRT